MNKVTNLQLYKFYEQESKLAREDVQTICIHTMELLKKIGLNKEADEEAISFLKTIIDINLELHELDFNNDAYRNLTSATSKSKDYSKVIKDNSGKYTCYPFSVSEPNYYSIIINHCLENNITMQESAEKLLEKVNMDNNSKAEDLLKNELNFYYGDVDYLVSRAIAIVDAMKMLAKREDLNIEDKKIISESLNASSQILIEMGRVTSLYDINFLRENNYSVKNVIISKEKYDSAVALYKEIIKYETTLEPISQKIWDNFFLTNNGMLVHKLTGEIVKSDEMSKICTSFYSNRAQFIPEHIGHTGYCYKFDAKNIFSVCETDVGSWQTTKEDFITRGLPSKMQFTENNMWYEYAYHSKLFSPEYLESKILLNNDFGEIVLDNSTLKNKPLMAFYTPEATKEEIQKITELAFKQGIEVNQMTFSTNNNFNK